MAYRGAHAEMLLVGTNGSINSTASPWPFGGYRPVTCHRLTRRRSARLSRRARTAHSAMEVPISPTGAAIASSTRSSRGAHPSITVPSRSPSVRAIMAVARRFESAQVAVADVDVAGRSEWSMRSPGRAAAVGGIVADLRKDNDSGRMGQREPLQGSGIRRDHVGRPGPGAADTRTAEVANAAVFLLR